MPSRFAAALLLRAPCSCVTRGIIRCTMRDGRMNVVIMKPKKQVRYALLRGLRKRHRVLKRLAAVGVVRLRDGH